MKDRRGHGDGSVPSLSRRARVSHSLCIHRDEDSRWMVKKGSIGFVNGSTSGDLACEADCTSVLPSPTAGWYLGKTVVSSEVGWKLLPAPDQAREEDSSNPTVIDQRSLTEQTRRGERRRQRWRCRGTTKKKGTFRSTLMNRRGQSEQTSVVHCLRTEMKHI